MIKNIVTKPDGSHDVTVSYADEGISLSVTRHVIGDPEAYAIVLDRDVRNNNPHLFPEPVLPVVDEEML